MRRLLTCLSAAAILATPAFAEATGFKSDLTSKLSGPLKLEVVVSEDLAHRANNLPKKLSDRGSGSRLNSSFSNNGRYGDREIEYLIEEMQEEIVEDFAKHKLSLSDDAPTLMRVTIDMAQPNRPTFNQLSRDTSLSFKSFGIGGADVSVEFIDAKGEIIGNASYDYYSSIHERQFQGRATWSDANRTFSRFSKRLSKKLASLGVNDS